MAEAFLFLFLSEKKRQRMKKNRGMGELAVAAPGQPAWFLADCRE